MSEMNSVGELELTKFDDSPIELDSVLGLREDCRYVIAEGGLGPQVLIAGRIARAQQAESVQNDQNRTAFVTDHASGEINFFCQRGNDQEQDYA